MIANARVSYPVAKLTDGITVICMDCYDEQFNFEHECTDCGGIVGDT